MNFPYKINIKHYILSKTMKRWYVFESFEEYHQAQ